MPKTTARNPLMVDMDGVLSNFVTGFYHVVADYALSVAPNKVKDLHPPLRQNEAPSWHWEEWIHPDRDFADHIINEAWRRVGRSFSFWYRLNPLCRTTELERLAKHHRGWPIVFVTRREAHNAWQQTVDWLTTHHILEPLVVRLPYGGGECKADVCKRLGLTVAIEDSPANALELSLAGIVTYVPTYPYNVHLAAEKKKGNNAIIMVQSVTEALDKLKVPR